MKSRKTMKHQQLIAETIDQLKARFQPRVPDVKKAIDAMIDREYIEREEGSRDSYRCVAGCHRAWFLLARLRHAAD